MTPKQHALSLSLLAFPNATVTKDEHGTFIVDATRIWERVEKPVAATGVEAKHTWEDVEAGNGW
jgi:hypothetical protein